MKFFFEIGNRFAKNSNWIDFALTKFCLFSMGIMTGLLVTDRYKFYACAAAAVVFVVTYIPLMTKVFKTIKEIKNEKQ